MAYRKDTLNRLIVDEYSSYGSYKPKPDTPEWKAWLEAFTQRHWRKMVSMNESLDKRVRDVLRHDLSPWD